MGGVTRLLLLLCVGVTVSTAEDLQKRIIGGKKCGDKERLYHVKLVDENNNFVCGGSLITDQWILTAAHCEPEAKKAVLEVHPGPGQPAKIPVKSVIYEENGKKHDIMLWKLPKPTDIDPVKPPDCKKRPSPKKDKVQIAGHGSSVVPCPRCEPHEPRTNDLQCAEIDVVDCPWINKPSINPKPHEHSFCGQTPGVDVCKGDSGGGAVHNNMIYGVIVTTGRTACTEPVEFMDVCSYMDWIKNTTAKTLLDKIKDCFGCG